MSTETEPLQVLLDRRLRSSGDFYRTGATRSFEFRRRRLLALKEAIRLREGELIEALRADLGKSPFESYTAEIGFVYEEIKFTLKRLRSWMKETRVSTPMVHFPSKSKIIPQPLGTVLILAPWNYPFQLLIAPLIGAIAAGCTAILKPSENAPATSSVLRELVAATFSPEYVDLVEGDGEVASALVFMPFDKIFFTGSTALGKKVMAAAADHLTPVVLELGGKSPTVVHKDANLEVAAKRIAWGKYMNAGQTCVAPDFVYVHESVIEEFTGKLRGAVERFFSEEPKSSPDYGRIINDRHFQRLSRIMEESVAHAESRLLFGGEQEPEERFIAPTAVRLPGWDSAAMEEEIFGPLLPLISYAGLDEVVEKLRRQPDPLAFYLFTESKSVKKKLLTTLSFGGASVNETVLHLVNPKLPFGGVGSSGMGKYHGKASFDAFTHYKGVLDHGTWLDIPLKYPPYTDKLLAMVRRIMG